MKHEPAFRRARRGMTIIELSLSLAVLLGLTTIVVFSMSSLGTWQRARDAGLDLRAVYIAQKGYLADHPTASIAAVTAGDLLPYLPSGYSAIPTPKDNNGNTLTVNFAVVPPVFTNGYDPSGATDDSQWDVGKR